VAGTEVVRLVDLVEFLDLFVGYVDDHRIRYIPVSTETL
jgi:hypothetical protein